MGATAVDIVDGEITDISIVTDLCTNILGNYTITYTAIDSYGNSADAIRTIEIVDTTPPVISLDPSIVLFEASSNPYIDNSINDNISDNYFEKSQLTIDVCSNVLSNVVGSYNVIYTVTDPCNNIASATRIVNVVDTTPPEITISGGLELILNLGVSYELSANVFAFDIVDGSVNVTISGSLDTTTEGTYNILYTATDSCGNDSSAVQIINVVNSNLPVITLNGDSSINILLGETYTELSGSAVDALGNNISNIVITGDQVNSDIADSYEIIYTATDIYGISASKTRTVNVRPWDYGYNPTLYPNTMISTFMILDNGIDLSNAIFVIIDENSTILVVK